MLAKPVQFLAILFMALALVPGGAHLFELPNKIGLGEDAYFAVQQIYAGWALFGIVLFGALTHAVGIFARRQRARYVRRLPERDAGGADRPQSRLRAVRSVCYSFPRRSPFSAAIWSDSIGR